MYVKPSPKWKAALLCQCGANAAIPLALSLERDTGVSSVVTIDTIVPQPRFHEMYDVGTGPLFGNGLSDKGTVSVVNAAYCSQRPVEAAVEALKSRCEAKSRSDDLVADLALYVQPLSSPDKDTPDGDPSVQLLDDAVSAWLKVPANESQVLLLHGHSGSGKSLYCALLEQQVWTRYRLGDPSSVTPLLVSLPAVKDAEKGAVEEALRECGVSMADASEGGSRRWLVILDGYDEVQGSANFVTGNKLLTLLPGVKVIVTCRTEYLEAKGSYRRLFTPGDAGRSNHLLTELFVRTFGAGQVSVYFHQWVRQNPDSAWSAERYVHVVNTTPA